MNYNSIKLLEIFLNKLCSSLVIRFLLSKMQELKETVSKAPLQFCDHSLRNRVDSPSGKVAELHGGEEGSLCIATHSCVPLGMLLLCTQLSSCIRWR